MSWLGGSISSLTGQLSNLTKDILTEGTEEIDDPATELRLAKEKIDQQNALLTSQRLENERLKHINKELEEKAESSELQINAISREYRVVLESKEREVNALKQQHQELLEQHAHSAAALSLPFQDGAQLLTSSSAAANTGELPHSWASVGGDQFSTFNCDGGHGDWDFDDSIRLQRENNTLRTELQKLQAEAKHWRSVAGHLGQNTGLSGDHQSANKDVLDLQHTVKSLEAQLAKKGDEMQQQAASLHEHHRQKVANLKASHKAELEAMISSHKAEIDALKLNHKTEIDSLNGQLTGLEQQLADARDGGNSSQHSGSGNLPESDRVGSTLREVELQGRLSQALQENQELQNARSHMESVLEDLQRDIEQIQKQKEGEAGDETLQRKVIELAHNLQESEERCQELEKELQEVREDLVVTKHRLLDQLDANHADAQEVLSELRELRSNMSTEAAQRRHEMQAERRVLVTQLFRVGQQKSHLTQSLLAVKEEQENVLAQTEAAIEKIGDKKRPEIAADLVDTLERENLLLKEEKLKLEENVNLLEKVASSSAIEKQTLLRKVTDLKSQLRDLAGEDWADTSDTWDHDLLSEDSTSVSDSRNAAVYVSKEEVEKELQLLRAQLESQSTSVSAVELERADWLLEREALEDVITDLRKQTQDQELEIKSLKSGKASIRSEDSIDENSSENLQFLEAEISSLREEKGELENALEELDTQHCQAQEQLIKQRDQLMSQLAERSAQIQQQQEEIEHLNSLITTLIKSGETQQLDEHDQGRQQLEERCRELEAELDEVKSRGSYSALEKEVTELRERLHKGGLVINDLHMDKQELEDELKLAKEDIAAKVAKLKEMREENAALLKEKKNLEEKILEMEERLSEMEEEVERWQQVNEDRQVNSGKVHEECDRLRSQVAAMERERLSSANFESLSAKQPAANFSLEDAAFGKILEEEAKVRKKIEDDSRVIQELKGEVQKLYESKQQLKREFHEQRRSHENDTIKITELENELRESKVLLESAVQEKSEVELRLEQELENIKSYKLKLSECNVEIEAARRENDELSTKMSMLRQENLNLTGQLDSWQKHEASAEEFQSDVMSKHQKLIDCQREMISSLQAEGKVKAKLEVMLEDKNLEIQNLNYDVAAVKQELSAAQIEITKLEDVCLRKDEEISKLKAEVTQSSSDSTEGKESVTITEEISGPNLSRTDEELQLLKDRNAFLEGSLNQLWNALKSVSVHEQAVTQMGRVSSSTVDDIGELEYEIERLKSELSEVQNLHESISQLEIDLTSSNELISRLRKDLAEAQETIRCHVAGIADLNEKADVLRHQLEQAEANMAQQKATAAILRQNSVEKEASISEMEEKMRFLLSILTQQQLEQFRNHTSTSDIPALEYKQLQAIEFTNHDRVHDSVHVHSQEDQEGEGAKLVDQPLVSEKSSLEVNGSIIEDDFDSGTSDQDRFTGLEKELDDLRDRLKEKDAIVADLQRSNSSLLALLEKGSSAFDKGLSSQVSIHKMEAELRGLRAEREQMVAVVTEKSRENSSLKSEVHRLMDIVSSGQAAIDKLQQDNRSLEQLRHSPPRDDEDDMRREALANMARLVRDRETEIEALKQKNETLLAVLQESSESQAAAHLAPLLRDKETLTQQLSSFTSEREQLIACVTQKHSESLAYHAEIQRLSAVLIESQAASEKVRKDYEALIPAYEDKSQALLSTQNELIRCKQKLTELEIRHGELIQRSSSQDSSSSPELSSLQSELERLRNIETDHRSTIAQQEEKIHVLNYRISTLEESIASKETECAHLRKQVESSKFQLSGLMAEISDMRAEREQIHQKQTAQDTESAGLRESYNRMCLEARDRNIELSSLKEQVMTLTSLLNEQQGEHGQVTKLMRENETAVASALQLQQERDQQTLLVEQKMQECGFLRNELSQVRDKEFRLTKELERLRGHLMEIEDGFTKDALESEEREKDLRNRLAVAEEQLMSSSLQVDMASKESRRQIESMQQQLLQVASQRDSAYMQVASIQEQCQQYAASLSNLQLVLEHFQKEKDAAIANETERLHNECKVLKIEVKELQAELQATRGDLSEALDGLEAASRLSEQLDRKEDAMAALREEVHLREQALTEAEEQIRKLTSSTEAKVDKTLMHNMVMTWLLSPENKRVEIVHLIGNILSFTAEDFQKIDAAQGKGGLLSGLFRRSSTTLPGSPARQTQTSNQSFSQLFVKFLEKESSPPPTPVKLPAEAMAAETQHRHKPAFNPFLAPRHVTQDRQRTSTPSSHILMSPDSPTSSPLFTPLTNISSSTESAILKDVLGK